MGETSDHHRPLTSGIRIQSARTVGGQTEHIDSGTLTGPATRNSDGKKVLVTCLHVVTGRIGTNPSGGEELYQEDARPHIVSGSWAQYVPDPDKKVGRLPAWDPLNRAWVPIEEDAENVADIAMCELLVDPNTGRPVDAEFTLHDAIHSGRKIIEGVVEPVDDASNPMELTVFGAAGAEGTVTVSAVDQERTINGYSFKGVTILDSPRRPIWPGDSGAACLYKVSEGRYRIACIVFSMPAGNPN